MITLEELKNQLNFNVETGIFTRISNSRRTDLLDKEAGCITPDGYRVISINNKVYLAHRLAWFYMTGQMPKEFLDHINGNRSDNRICNLREANNSENLKNVKTHKDNSTGYKGVHKHSDGRYRAQGMCDGKKYHLGLFYSAKMAHDAYVEFIEKYHGAFARAA